MITNEKEKAEIKNNEKTFLNKKQKIQRILGLYSKKKNNKTPNFKIAINNKKINILLFNLGLIFLPLFLSKEIKFKQLAYDYEILLTIKGTGEKQIINNAIKDPYKIYLDGIETSFENKVISISSSNEDETHNVSIIWNSSVESCNSMFSDLNYIIKIDLSKFDSSQVTEMQNMFYNLKELTSLNLNNLNTTLVNNMGNMFYECQKLETLNLSSFDTSSVTNMEKMFLGCQSIKSLDLSNFDTSLVTNICTIFLRCYSLEYVNLNGFNTSLIGDMDFLFGECYNLKSLNLSSFNTYNVNSMANMLEKCRHLEIIDLSSFDTSNVENMGHIFSECNSLKSLNLSNFNNSKLKYIDNMFENCYSLSILDLKNFGTSSVIDINGMFKNCYSLKYLDISNFDTSKVTNMDNLFFNCYSLTSLELGNFNTSLVTTMQNMFYNLTLLTSLNLNSFNLNSLNEGIITKIFYELNSSLKYCITDDINDELKIILKNYSQINCSQLCEQSSQNKYYFQEENKCLNKCSDNKIYIFDYDNICYKSCPNGTYNISDSYSCKDILICEKFYNYNLTECLDEIPLGYYLNDSKSKTIDKCDIKCSNCTLESLTNNLCIKCNIEKGYYPKFKENFDNDSFINCYNEKPESHYFDNINNIYMPCNSSCKECNGSESNQCINCYDNYSLNNGYCLKTESSVLYEDIKSDTTIIYKEINQSTNLITSIITDIYSDEKNSNEFSYETNTNFVELQKIYNNSTFINLSPSEFESIYNKFNLDKEKDKVIVIIDFFKSKDSRMAISDFNYLVFLDNGTELNLSNLDEDFFVDIAAPISDLQLVKFNYSIYFSEQGYDIYDKNSDFYNDFCTVAYQDDNDITLDDRKKYIYPNNVSLCKNNCKYKRVNIDEEKIICSCNLNLNSNENYNEDDDDFLEEDDGNFVSYLLDNINYKIYKCYKLIYIFDNLKNNHAFYSLISIYITILTINFIFFFYSLPNLKKAMYKDTPCPNKVRLELIKELNKFKNQRASTNLKKKRKKKSFKKIVIVKIINNCNNSTSSHFFKTKEKKEKIFNEIEQEKEKEKEQENLNELPYAKAIILDKRSILKLFYSLIIQKLELIDLFCSNRILKSIILCEYILSLLINFYFNALLYTDEVISNKYHNNGELDFIVTLMLSLTSNIITSIICYFMKYSKDLDERFELIMQIKKEYYYLINIITFSRYLKIKFFCFIIIEIVIFIFCFYYIIIVFIIYSKSTQSLIMNYFISLLEGTITSFALAIIITALRKIGIVFLNKQIYNISKYINDKF